MVHTNERHHTLWCKGAGLLCTGRGDQMGPTVPLTAGPHPVIYCKGSNRRGGVGSLRTIFLTNPPPHDNIPTSAPLSQGMRQEACLPLAAIRVLGTCGSSKNVNISRHVSVTRTELPVTHCPSKAEMWFQNMVVAYKLFLRLRLSEESSLPGQLQPSSARGLVIFHLFSK